MIPIASSIGGVVIEKTVTQGEVIGPDKNLFTVADLSTLWLQIDLYEKDLARIKDGQGVNLSVTALPDSISKAGSPIWATCWTKRPGRSRPG